MEVLIDHIIKNKIKCFFVSPHQDDAIFSAGGLISYLTVKTEVNIVNVFSGCGKTPYTLSAKSFFKQCSYDNAEKLANQRNREEESIRFKSKIKFVPFMSVRIICE